MIERLNPQDIEKKVITNKSILVKTDRTGCIEYVNIEYVNLSEYEIDEIIGKDINVLAHPDMPTIIFDHIWASLFQKKRTHAIIKNISKSGKFFWLQVNFDFKVNEETREIEYIYAYYSKASQTAIKELDILYKKVRSIEDRAGVEIAENYLNGFLDEKGIEYNNFIGQYLS